MTSILATIEKLEELEKKATPGLWYITTEDAHPTMWLDRDKEKEFSIHDLNLIDESRNSLPTLLTALKEAIDLIETLEKVFEKYPMYARMAEGKMEPIGNPCAEFLKNWTTE